MHKLIRGTRDTSKLHNNFFIVASLILTFILLNYVTRLTDLRPIADDYCSISTSYDGPLSASLKYFSNVNGDLWAMFLYSLFVGTPLLLFGVSIGSAMTQIVLLLSLVFIFDSAFRMIFSNQKHSHLSRYIISLCGLLSWFQYWMLPRARNVPLTFEFEGNLRLLSESVLHWKTVQVTYLIVPISIIFLALLISKTIKSSQSKLVVFTLLAVVVGLSGYIFATTSILTIIFVVYFKKFTEKVSKYQALILISGVLLGCCISFFSPGSTSRKQALANYPNLSIQPLESLNNSLLTLLSMLLSLGVLSSFVTGVFLRNLFSDSISNSRIPFLRDLKSTLLYSLIVSFITVCVANHRVGWSAWHMLLPFTLNWLYWLSVGFTWNSKIRNSLQFSKVTTTFVLFLLGSTYAIQTAIVSIDTRHTGWNIGPAPTSGIEDREVEWVRTCINTKIYG